MGSQLVVCVLEKIEVIHRPIGHSEYERANDATHRYMKPLTENRIEFKNLEITGNLFNEPNSGQNVDIPNAIDDTIANERQYVNYIDTVINKRDVDVTDTIIPMSESVDETETIDKTEHVPTLTPLPNNPHIYIDTDKQDPESDDITSKVLYINKENLGRVIGRRGATIKKIRNISKADILISNDIFYGNYSKIIITCKNQYIVSEVATLINKELSK